MDDINNSGLNEYDLEEIAKGVDRVIQNNQSDDGIDFASIQKIFAQRDKELITKELREKELEEKKAQLAAQESSEKKPDILEVKTIKKLKSEKKYDNMHAKNIRIRKKSKQLIQKATAVLVIGALVVTGTAVWSNQQKNKRDEKSTTSYSDENFVAKTINPEECDLSNYIILLKESTENVRDLSKIASIELNTLGIENNTIKSNESLVRKIREIKSRDDNREIIVINLDGEMNTGATETIVITNYANGAKSADSLALAIHNANEGIYGITSDVRCGKKAASGGYRERTSAEAELYEAGIISIPTLTIAPNRSFLTEEINQNNLATSIVEGIVRIAALEETQRYADIIRRVDYGDTLSEIAAKNDVSESYIISQNCATLSNTAGILKVDTPLIVRGIPEELTSDSVVSNKAVTTNPNDLKSIISYYVVAEDDTVSEIAERLGIPQDDLIVPSGDANKINVGDKIGYTTTSGPILVTKTNEKAK